MDINFKYRFERGTIKHCCACTYPAPLREIPSGDLMCKVCLSTSLGGRIMAATKNIDNLTDHSSMIGFIVAKSTAEIANHLLDELTDRRKDLSIEKNRQSIQAVENKSQPFAMSEAWLPGERFRDRLTRAGLHLIDEREFVTHLQEFQLYWLGHPDRKFTEDQWQGKLLRSIQRNRVNSAYSGDEGFTLDDREALIAKYRHGGAPE